MTTLSIQPPFPIFSNRDGSPLENGYVWIGTANLNPLTSPIAVYWDAGLTLPAAQPIRTINGYPANNGTPARLYVNSDYSIQVQDSKGTLVYGAPAATERYSNVVVPVTAADIAFLAAGVGADPRTVQGKLRDTISVLDFGADPTGAVDSALAFQEAIDAIYSPAQNVGWGGTLLIPPGTYLIGTTLTIDKHINIEAYGARINCLAPRCFDIGNPAYLTDLTAGYFRVRIAGLYINHSGASEVIRNQGIRRIVLERVQTIGGLHSLYTEGAFDCPVIDNCRFQNSISHGINIAQRNNLFTVRNTAVLGSAGYGIHMNTAGAELKGVKLWNLDTEGCAGGIFIGGNTGNVLMDGCWFENNTVFNIRVDNTAGTANKYGISIYNCQITGAGVDVVIGNDPAGTLIDGVEITANEFVDSELTIVSWDKVKNFVQLANRKSGTATFNLDSSVQDIRIGRGNGGEITNTVFGVGSGNDLDQSTTLGNQNTFFGYQAGLYCTTGYNNVFMGRWAGVNTTTGYANVVVGNRALESAATSYNNVALGNAALTALTSGTQNTAVGSGAGATLTTTAESVAVGINALNGPAGMDRCIAIGKEAGATATNGIADSIIIGTQSTATGSNSISIGTGTTAAANTIRMGNASITTANIQVGWTVTSDRRAKKEIADLDLGLAFVQALRPVSFRRINGNDTEELGFIAQEVQSAIPRPLGMLSVDESGTYALRKDDLIAVLVKAVQELTERVRALENA